MTKKLTFASMGKSNNLEYQDHTLHGSLEQQQSNSNIWPCWCHCIGLKCVFIFVLSVAVFLSALFWLPPFIQFADQGDLDPALHFKGHEIVARFYLERPVSILKENIEQLKEDIFEEIAAPYVNVLILQLKPLAGTNMTRVVFGVDSVVKHTKIPEPAKSLIRSTFKDLVIKRLLLQLSKPLFGDPDSFEVLKFPGGITIIPPQSAFLLQKVQVPFNFTLNFSIHQLQASFLQLSSQLKSGLRLAPYEFLYIELSNSRGSTVSPPTTVHSSVLLEVRNTKSGPRLKQLAQTINGSNSGNLGLNNTEFGKVKGVSLSSILQHSLNGSDGNSSSVSSPSPAPLPNPQPDNHYHHLHHHHHRHHHHAQVSPAVSPAPVKGKDSSAPHMGAPVPRSSPGPRRSYEPRPPGCNNGYRHKSKRKDRKRSYLAPAVPPEMPHNHKTPSPATTVAPSASPHYVAPAPSIARNIPSRHAGASPQGQVRPPGSISASSPLPSVQLPSNGPPNGGHSVATPPAKSSHVPSAADPLDTLSWPVLLCLVVMYQLSSN